MPHPKCVRTKSQFDKIIIVCHNTVLQNTKGLPMTATVRLDDNIAEKLETLSFKLHKKKSDVIRDAITFYAQNVEATHKSKMLKAVEKVMREDKNEYKTLEGTLDDGL